MYPWVWVVTGIKWEWSFRWSRPLRSWELDQVNYLLGLLSNLNLAPNYKDRIIWMHDHLGAYSVKLASKVIFSLSSSYVSFSMNDIWHSLAPPKVEIFVWLALLRKLNTKDLLLEKGIIDSHNSYCSFCNRVIESMDHLFILCPLAQSI